MTLFMTSNTGRSVIEDGHWILGAFYEENGLRSNLQKRWPWNARFLCIASDPDDTEMNDSIAASVAGALEASGLPIADLAVLDRRNQDQAAERIRESSVIQLCGGHVPTQNSFFRELGLAELLQDFDGIVIGVSAGSMNCGRVVYAQPELEGEALDPDYPRYLEGLGLADITMLPHFNQLPGTVLDGLDIIEEISLPDSFLRPFFAIPDGSYFLWRTAAPRCLEKATGSRTAKSSRYVRTEKPSNSKDKSWCPLGHQGMPIIRPGTVCRTGSYDWHQPIFFLISLRRFRAS